MIHHDLLLSFPTTCHCTTKVPDTFYSPIWPHTAPCQDSGSSLPCSHNLRKQCYHHAHCQYWPNSSCICCWCLRNLCTQRFKVGWSSWKGWEARIYSCCWDFNEWRCSSIPGHPCWEYSLFITIPKFFWLPQGHSDIKILFWVWRQQLLVNTLYCQSTVMLALPWQAAALRSNCCHHNKPWETNLEHSWQRQLTKWGGQRPDKGDNHLRIPEVLTSDKSDDNQEQEQSESKRGKPQSISRLRKYRNYLLSLI